MTRNHMEKRANDRINIDHTWYTTRISARHAARKPYAPADPGVISSFIPGTVVEVMVRVGDTVEEGDDILILDAMKMKNRLKSHVAGRVTAVSVKPGDRVSKGAVLAVVEQR